MIPPISGQTQVTIDDAVARIKAAFDAWEIDSGAPISPIDSKARATEIALALEALGLIQFDKPTAPGEYPLPAATPRGGFDGS